MVGSLVSNNFNSLYLDNCKSVENFINNYKIKYSAEELVSVFVDLYINMLEKDKSEMFSDRKTFIEFRLVGSAPDQEKGKKKVQLLRFGKNSFGTELDLLECKLFIERFKQIREFRKIDSIQTTIEEYEKKLLDLK